MAVDLATINAGIPGLILMENAAHAVVEYLAHKCGPVAEQRIVIFCGKGGNGGDGLAIARVLHVRFPPRHFRERAPPDTLLRNTDTRFDFSGSGEDTK